MITNNAPKYNYMPQEGIETIHETTMRVLEEFGIAHQVAREARERANQQWQATPE